MTMTGVNENHFLIPAWGVSLTLHGAVVVLAMLFAAQVRPPLQEEPFKWDVALVETVKTDSASEPTPQPASGPAEQVVPPLQAPRGAARRSVEPPPDTVMHRVAPQQTVQMVHPQAQPTKPVEQREEPVPPLKTEPVTPPVKPVQETPAEPVEQIVEAPKPQPEPAPALREPDPVPPADPMVGHAQPTEPVESRPMETPAKPSAPEPLISAAPAEPAPAVSSPPNSAPQEAPIQAAKAPPGPATKVDHRWIAESLWRRVAELKRYPSSARLNGQEGKVILKAIIRADGHLAEVSIQKSSGHQILDAAAIEAVKLACPLHMKHAIGKPEIVVSLPIVYSLAN
jgi:periplasmic protein TonB